DMNQEPTTTIDPAPATPPTDQTTATAQTPETGQPSDVQPTEDAFDPAAVEEAFGLPPGSLNGVTDVDAALEQVRTYVDQTLAAGLGAEDSSNVPETPAPQSPEPSASKQPAKGGSPDLDALRAKIETLEAKLAARDKANEERLAAEL